MFPNAREKLLLKEDEESLNLSLYLDNSVISNLNRNNPEIHLDQDNFEDLCLALEGISHFIYMIWNATHDRSVTLLEMELQAEIDKFVVLSAVIEQQNHALTGGELRRILFESVSYDTALSETQRQRYRDANYFAEKYCWQLQTNFLSSGANQDLLNELRRFYRLTQKQKLRRIGH